MSVEKRSALMSRIRGKDTKPELAVGAMLAAREVRPESHPRDLPGRPDFVLRDLRLAIFVDGDFWHGWRFPSWAHKLAPFWAEKIAKNRARDRRNFARLRRTGWTVVRIWEHDIKKDPDRVARRIEALLSAHPSHRKKARTTDRRTWHHVEELILFPHDDKGIGSFLRGRRIERRSQQGGRDGRRRRRHGPDRDRNLR